MDNSKTMRKDTFYKAVIEYVDILDKENNTNILQKSIIQNAIIDFAIWILKNKFLRNNREEKYENKH